MPGKQYAHLSIEGSRAESDLAPVPKKLLNLQNNRERCVNIRGSMETSCQRKAFLAKTVVVTL